MLNRNKIKVWFCFCYSTIQTSFNLYSLFLSFGQKRSSIKWKLFSLRKTKFSFQSTANNLSRIFKDFSLLLSSTINQLIYNVWSTIAINFSTQSDSTFENLEFCRIFLPLFHCKTCWFTVLLLCTSINVNSSILTFVFDSELATWNWIRNELCKLL